MKYQRSFVFAVFAGMALAILQATAIGQTGDSNLANLSGGGSSVKWEVLVANSGMTLTISAPDGRSFRRDYKAGANPEMTLSDRQFEGLPDGTYSYELRLRPVLSAGAKEAMAKARGKDDDPEAERAGRKRAGVPSLVQSGSFAILNGSIIVPGAVEGQRSTAKKSEQPRMPASGFGNTFSRLRNHRMYFGARPDDVVPDDQIVQGSECVGLDCVNGEVFNFDTIRLKENNTRIGFMDTSTSAGFPTNDWTIRANESGSGGGSFLAFVDQGSTGTGSEVGTINFRVDAGAPANSLRVSSNGKVGLRTGTPVLDLHITTSDTPAHRLEQTNAGGFSAQTWDIAGNEANFFVRDVTSGSRLPFRIRPGAPTSSIDIAANGDVGVGIGSPGYNMHVFRSGAQDNVLVGVENGTREWSLGINGASDFFRITDQTAGAARLTILNNGRVGISTNAPDQVFSVNGDASKTGGGSWQSFSDVRLKNIKGRFSSGLSAVMQLQPLRYEYKADNALGLKSEGEHVGFAAQELKKIIPEAVTTSDNGYLMVNNDPIIWTMLNAIKEQQKQIADLKAEVQKLQAASPRRKR